MSKLDLGLINGQNWSAAGLDAVEAGINLITIVGTAAERAAMTGIATGQGFFETDTGRFFRYYAGAWRGTQTTSHGGGTPVGITTAGTAESLCNTLTVPDQGCAGYLNIWGEALLAGGTAGDTFELRLKIGGTQLAAARQTVATTTGSNQFSVFASTSMFAGAGNTIDLRVARTLGSGAVSTFADAGFNRINAIFVPS